MPASLLLAAGVALLAAALVLAGPTLRLRARVKESAVLLDRAIAAAGEVEHAARARDQLAATQQLAESGVDGMNMLVRDGHQAVAALAFGILEDLPATQDTTRIVREVHDAVSDGVYDAVSGINRLIGLGLRVQLGDDAASSQPPQPASEAKPPAADTRPTDDEQPGP